MGFRGIHTARNPLPAPVEDETKPVGVLWHALAHPVLATEPCNPHRANLTLTQHHFANPTQAMECAVKSKHVLPNPNLNRFSNPNLIRIS